MILLIIAIVTIIIISIICMSYNQPMITGGGSYFNESGITGSEIDPALTYNKPHIDGSIDDIGSIDGGSNIDVSPYSEMIERLNKRGGIKKHRRRR